MESPAPTPDWLTLLTLEQSSFVPKYVQLADRLRNALQALPEGTTIPSEKELMDLTGVGRATARAAVTELVREGLLVAHRGRGTFKQRARLDTSLARPSGFSESMTALGRKPSSRVLSVSTLPANESIAGRLGVDVGTSLLCVERLRLIDDEPCMLERTHLIAGLVPGLAELDLTDSLYEILRVKYGLAPSRGTESILSLNADAHVAHILGIPIAAAVLATTRVTHTSSGSPVEYTLRHARGDLCSFTVSLDSGPAADGSPVGLLVS